MMRCMIFWKVWLLWKCFYFCGIASLQKDIWTLTTIITDSSILIIISLSKQASANWVALYLSYLRISASQSLLLIRILPLLIGDVVSRQIGSVSCYWQRL